MTKIRDTLVDAYAGETDPVGDDGMWSSQLDVRGDAGVNPVTHYSVVEVYGDTKEAAESMRSEILQGLALLHAQSELEGV